MNKLTKIILGIIAIGLIVWAVIASQNPQVNQKIKVGVILPLSGQYAALGESDRNAIIMAKEDLKADNIEFIFEDDKYDAKTAVTAYQKLASIDHIDAVVVLSAPSIQAIAPLTNKQNIPLLGLGGTIVYEKDSVFQLMPSSDSLFPTLGKIYGEKYKNIAVAHSSATLFADNTKAFMKGLPTDVKAQDIIISSASDYRTEVQKIIALNPDAVTTFMPKEDAIKFLKALRVQDGAGKIKIVCDFGTAIAIDEYTAAIGADRLEGCIATNLADTTTEEFKAKYKSRFGGDMMITADFAYDAVGMIQKLASQYAKQDWVKELSASGFAYKGEASGEIKFNDNGTRLDLPPKVDVYKGGKFVPAN